MEDKGLYRCMLELTEMLDDIRKFIKSKNYYGNYFSENLLKFIEKYNNNVKGKKTDGIKILHILWDIKREFKVIRDVRNKSFPFTKDWRFYNKLLKYYSDNNVEYMVLHLVRNLSMRYRVVKNKNEK